MTNYREILRLHSLGLNKTEIASSCRCARNAFSPLPVVDALRAAQSEMLLQLIHTIMPCRFLRKMSFLLGGFYAMIRIKLERWKRRSYICFSMLK